jgi:zinc/manganese transport system substrate-binding protein
MAPVFLKRTLMTCALFLSGRANAEATKLKVVYSTSFLSNIASEVTCGKSFADETTLISSEVDPHTFSLKPSDRAKIAEADLVFFIGEGFETWMSRLKAGKNKTYIEVSQGLSLHKITKQAHHHGHQHQEAGHSKDWDVDVHVWHSPLLVKEVARKMATSFKERLPHEGHFIDSCLEKFQGKVSAEVEALKKYAAQIDEKKRVIATNHDALGYFAEAFGIKIESILSTSTEASPTPLQIKTVLRHIKEKGIKAIFLESTADDKIVKSVAKEGQIQVGGQLYTDGLGPKGSGAETTLTMWRKNMETIIEALKK